VKAELSSRGNKLGLNKSITRQHQFEVAAVEIGSTDSTTIVAVGVLDASVTRYRLFQAKDGWILRYLEQ